jgi:uncharacterized protein YuzE
MVYITLNSLPVQKTVELSDNVVVDIDMQNNLVGIEVLNCRRGIISGSILT